MANTKTTKKVVKKPASKKANATKKSTAVKKKTKPMKKVVK